MDPFLANICLNLWPKAPVAERSPKAVAEGVGGLSRLPPVPCCMSAAPWSTCVNMSNRAFALCSPTRLPSFRVTFSRPTWRADRLIRLKSAVRSPPSFSSLPAAECVSALAPVASALAGAAASPSKISAALLPTPLAASPSSSSPGSGDAPRLAAERVGRCECRSVKIAAMRGEAEARILRILRSSARIDSSIQQSGEDSPAPSSISPGSGDAPDGWCGLSSASWPEAGEVDWGSLSCMVGRRGCVASSRCSSGVRSSAWWPGRSPPMACCSLAAPSSAISGVPPMLWAAPSLSGGGGGVVCSSGRGSDCSLSCIP